MKKEEYYEELYEERSEKKLRGFTLIELIVVITIIGILAAIIVPTMVGWVEKANNRADAENARILCETIQAEVMYEPNFEVFTLNPWPASGTQLADDHGYIYVDKNEVRVSSYRLAELLQECGYITSAADFDAGHRGTPVMKDGVELAAEYIYKRAKCKNMLCKSNITWYRYQVNVCYRDGTIKFTFAAISKDGETKNTVGRQGSLNNTSDESASEIFARMAGIGEAETVATVGDNSTP